MGQRWKLRCSGAAAGLINGLFGGGGGAVLVLLLQKLCGMDPRRSFASSVAVMLPLCAVSAALCLWRTDLSVLTALPYLLGGLAGGFTGGRLMGRVSPVWLRRIFALFLLYGGVRYLW